MRKIKYTISLLFLITIFSSCSFFGPVDSKTMKPISIKPKNIELIGKWEIDSFSYNYIKKDYNIDNKKVIFEIQKNGELVILKFIGDPDSANRLLFKKIKYKP